MLQTPYVYILVREDIAFEQQAVQSTHAAIEAARYLIPPQIEHPHVIICGVGDEMNLKKEASHLSLFGIKYKPFYEADIDNQLTAIATEPIYGKDRKHFKKFKLLKCRSNTY